MFEVSDNLITQNNYITMRTQPTGDSSHPNSLIGSDANPNNNTIQPIKVSEIVKDEHNINDISLNEPKIIVNGLTTGQS